MHPTWSFKHHSRLFAGFFMFIYIGWIYSRILLFFTSLFKSYKQSVQCLSGNILPCNYSCSPLNCLRIVACKLRQCPKGFGVVYSTALPAIMKYPSKVRTIYRISRRISRVSGHQNRGQKIDLDLYEGHIISVVRLLIKNLACLAICSF